MKFLSKYYFLNILAYFSLFANLLYVFYACALCINYIFFSNKNIYDYLGLFAKTFNYYFVIFCIIFVIIISFIIELFLRKIGKINNFHKTENTLYPKILLWLSLFLIPLSFLFFVANILYFSMITYIY